MSNNFQRDVAKLLLKHLDTYGFALSGGLALVELGLTSRPTKDIDLFTLEFDNALLDNALTEAMAALKKAGYVATLGRKSKTFARIDIDLGDKQLSVDFGYDYREYDTVKLDVGSVIDKRDAILNKVSALYSRMLPRDFIDTYSILESGVFSKADILGFSKERDPGFVLEFFVDSLRKVRNLSLEDFREYGTTVEAFEAIKEAMNSWADEIESGLDS